MLRTKKPKNNQFQKAIEHKTNEQSIKTFELKYANTNITKKG